MKKFALVLAVLIAVPAFAQDAGVLALDAGISAAVPAVDAGVAEADAGVVIPTDVLVKTVFSGVKDGNWWMVAAALLVLLVGALRAGGKAFHAWLPDDNIMDKPLWFLFDTKVGGWLLNWLTTMAGVFSLALSAGAPVDISVWKMALIVSTSGTALLELVRDIKDWIAERAAKKAALASALAPIQVPLVAVVPAVPPVEPPKA